MTLISPVGMARSRLSYACKHPKGQTIAQGSVLFKTIDYNSPIYTCAMSCQAIRQSIRAVILEENVNLNPDCIRRAQTPRQNAPYASPPAPLPISSPGSPPYLMHPSQTLK